MVFRDKIITGSEGDQQTTKRIQQSWIQRKNVEKLVEEVVKFLTGSAPELSSLAITELVSDQFKLSLNELRSRSRKRAIAFPRQVAMYLCRKYTEETLAEIGKVFNRDHSTVMHAVKVVSSMNRRDTSVASQLKLLSDKLQQL